MSLQRLGPVAAATLPLTLPSLNKRIYSSGAEQEPCQVETLGLVVIHVDKMSEVKAMLSLLLWVLSNNDVRVAACLGNKLLSVNRVEIEAACACDAARHDDVRLADLLPERPLARQRALRRPQPASDSRRLDWSTDPSALSRHSRFNDFVVHRATYLSPFQMHMQRTWCRVAVSLSATMIHAKWAGRTLKGIIFTRLPWLPNAVFMRLCRPRGTRFSLSALTRYSSHGDKTCPLASQQ